MFLRQDFIDRALSTPNVFLLPSRVEVLLGLSLVLAHVPYYKT